MSRPVVLNTRPQHQAVELSAQLRAAGMEPLETPAIELVPAWEELKVGGAVLRLSEGSLGWVVVASASAADYLLQALADAGSEPSVLNSATILCSAAAAPAFQDVGVTTVQALESFSAGRALATVTASRAERSAVLLPRARAGRDELLVGLQQAGFDIVDLPLYETRPVGPERLSVAIEALELGKVAVVTFASPSAVSAYSTAAQTRAVEPARLRVQNVCIGDTTAAAAREDGWRVDAVAASPDVPGLVDAVRQALNTVGALS